MHRVRMAKAYDVPAYYLSKLLVQVPFDTFPLLVSASVVYWRLGLHHSPDVFAVSLLLSVLVILCPVGFAFAPWMRSIFSRNCCSRSISRLVRHEVLASIRSSCLKSKGVPLEAPRWGSGTRTFCVPSPPKTSSEMSVCTWAGSISSANGSLWTVWVGDAAEPRLLPCSTEA